MFKRNAPPAARPCFGSARTLAQPTPDSRETAINHSTTMTKSSTNETKDLALLSFVQKLKGDDDRGTLALLRGALTDSDTRQMRAWRVLARFGGIPTGDFHSAEVVRTVAGLLALPRLSHKPDGTSFGEVCRKLLADDERKSLHKPDHVGPVARRVQHLLAATRGEICDRVRQ